MRLSLVFFMLILLPVAAAVHAWLFCRDNLPALSQEAVKRLKDAGVRDPVVDIRFFDIAVTGEAPDPDSRKKALQAIRSLVPLRLQPGADRLHVLAGLNARLDSNTLHLTGWLPEGDEIENVRQLLAELRLDLTLNTQALHTAPEVRWAEGTKPPLTASSPLLKPVLDMLRVPAELHISAKDDAILLSGLLPATALKHELVSALAEVAGARVVDPSALKASPHVLTASFARPESLAAFVSSFFQAPPPRSFDISGDGIPHLSGLATRQMESQWLALLRPVTGSAKVDARLTFLPSTYHFPGYQPRSAIPPATLEAVRGSLRDAAIHFETGSSQIPAEEQTKLTALAPVLLSAGPALGIIVGAHPDPAGPDGVEKEIGRARAQAVMSFLIDQGVPANFDVVVFDPVPASSAGAPAMPRTVELLIR